MRSAFISAALVLVTFVIAASGGEPAAHPSVSLLSGSDTPRTTQCPDGAAYVYKGYTIYVTQSAESPGQGISVYEPPSPPSDPCGEGKGGRYFSIPADESGDYLFIDQGTGPSFRTISIFDMKEKTFPLLEIRYSDAKIEDGALTYYESRDEVSGVLAKIPCPQASEWKKQGLDVVYEEKMSFDLKTGRESSLRQFRCSPAQ